MYSALREVADIAISASVRRYQPVKLAPTANAFGGDTLRSAGERRHLVRLERIGRRGADR